MKNFKQLGLKLEICLFSFSSLVDCQYCVSEVESSKQLYR